MFVYIIDNTITGEYLEFTEEAEPFVRRCWEKVISDPGKIGANRGKISRGLERVEFPQKARRLPRRAYVLGGNK